MVTALESKSLLIDLGEDASETAVWMLDRTSGTFESRRLQMLDTLPGVIAFYSEASAAVAADFYMETRVGVAGAFVAAPIVLDRTVNIRRSIAWASDPLSVDDWDAAAARLSEVMPSEVARPYRDTIIGNGKNDGKFVGWKRIASSSACGFCKALASRGAVYKQSTANFAAHNTCMCTCAPAFVGQPHGPEASVMQYMASKRTRTARERALIRDWAGAYE